MVLTPLVRDALVETALDVSSLGRWIAVDAKLTIIADTLTAMATATIRLRGRDFDPFVTWASTEEMDLNNICESTAYSFSGLIARLNERQMLLYPASILGSLWHGPRK
eukprot:3488741-Amphidinium_carterae.1